MDREDFEVLGQKQREKDASFEHHVQICMSSGCMASGSDAVKQALDAEVKERDMRKTCQVRGVGCLGLCGSGPIMAVGDNDVLYQKVKPEDASDIIENLGKGAVERIELPQDTPFFQSQQRIVLGNAGKVDPEEINTSLARDGYKALYEATVEMSPSDVLREIINSGLRGRGGAGYPTGLKWSTVAKMESDIKYIVCNGDEGDPGAFMDRSIMESDPHRVLEGMAIAAYAVGASKGYIYIRAEYALAIKRLKRAIRQAEKIGVLGKNIFGSTFSFDVELRLGAGAFVCGEETALLASIEGKRGNPRPRPPYPAQSGLWGKSTLINNVETLSNIAPNHSQW
jgi:bidirectional [NiFe] hydrogenase diaphorase subunit